MSNCQNIKYRKTYYLQTWTFSATSTKHNVISYISATIPFHFMSTISKNFYIAHLQSLMKVRQNSQKEVTEILTLIIISCAISRMIFPIKQIVC